LYCVFAFYESNLTYVIVSFAIKSKFQTSNKRY